MEFNLNQNQLDNHNNIIIDSLHEIEELDNEIEELDEKMNNNCNETVNKFYKLKKNINTIQNILKYNFNNKFANNNFDDHELIEEQIDHLIYEFSKIKESIKNGRIIKYYKEQKENEKKKELLWYNS